MHRLGWMLLAAALSAGCAGSRTPAARSADTSEDRPMEAQRRDPNAGLVADPDPVPLSAWTWGAGRSPGNALGMPSEAPRRKRP